MMDLSMPVEEFKAYMGQQLDRFFPDRYAFAGADVDAAFDEALQRLEYCLKFVSIRGFVVDGKVQLSHLHSGQYCHLLYFVGNSLWKRSQNQALCDKLMLLNQALNGVFCSYKLALPEIFFLNHPVGSVLGHAQYSNFLVILQNVTVNTDPELKIGECVALTAGAQIIGNKPIGARSSIGANTLVFDREIPADSVVYNGPTGLVIRPRGRESLAERYFNVPSA